MIKIFSPKKVIKDQNYENYWSITLEYSDIFGTNFNNCLDVIVRFIDNLPVDTISNNYKALQDNLNTIFPKADGGSTRKSINQFVKLGFIYPQFKGYPKETKKFLKTNDKTEKRILFSHIVYKNSNLNSSITEENPLPGNEINFLVKTLENVKIMTKEDLIALMTVNIAGVRKGFFTRSEIDKQVSYVNSIGFLERKYNQVSYMWGILKKLEGIEVREDLGCLTIDSEELLDDKTEFKKRDSYLQRLYKDKLKYESKVVFGIVACMVTGMAYKRLVASHIKPFRYSSEEEEYDPDNGILLSQDIDQLFDSGEITFDLNGNIIFSRRLMERDFKIVQNLERYSLGNIFFNENRKKYMTYHQHHIFLDNKI